VLIALSCSELDDIKQLSHCNPSFKSDNNNNNNNNNNVSRLKTTNANVYYGLVLRCL